VLTAVVGGTIEFDPVVLAGVVTVETCSIVWVGVVVGWVGVVSVVVALECPRFCGLEIKPSVR
jgi:hypothetical protein